jgi:hypothetical protein
MPSQDGHPVTFHIGTPKSGTTSLQNILARNRDLLREHGFLYPGRNQGHFIEAMSLREGGFRGHEFENAEGAWDRVVAEVLAHEGPTLISHEILGGSKRKIVQRAAESLPGRRLRVVITCRDLGRQFPAVWQEGVKNGDTVTYSDFLASSFEGWDGPGASGGMWRGQNLASVADRWGSVVGHENVVIVTVPPSGADKDVLWRRFVEAVGLPDLDYVVPDLPRNPSLGTVETELLRRVVARLPQDLPWPTYARQVKRRLAQKRLVKEKAGGSLSVPPAHHDDVRRVSAEMLEAIRDQGCQVVGDLADLEPAFAPGGTSPDDVTEAQLLERALDVLVPLVLNDGPKPTREPITRRIAEQGARKTGQRITERLKRKKP